jgi:hypothetical protein
MFPGRCGSSIRPTGRTTTPTPARCRSPAWSSAGLRSTARHGAVRGGPAYGLARQSRAHRLGDHAADQRRPRPQLHQPRQRDDHVAGSFDQVVEWRAWPHASAWAHFRALRQRDRAHRPAEPPMTFQSIQPLQYGVPIVEKSRGPTQQFQRLFNTAFKNSQFILSTLKRRRARQRGARSRDAGGPGRPSGGAGRQAEPRRRSRRVSALTGPRHCRRAPPPTLGRSGASRRPQRA